MHRSGLPRRAPAKSFKRFEVDDRTSDCLMNIINVPLAQCKALFIASTTEDSEGRSLTRLSRFIQASSILLVDSSLSFTGAQTTSKSFMATCPNMLNKQLSIVLSALMIGTIIVNRILSAILVIRNRIVDKTNCHIIRNTCGLLINPHYENYILKSP